MYGINPYYKPKQVLTFKRKGAKSYASEAPKDNLNDKWAFMEQERRKLEKLNNIKLEGK